MKDRYLFKARGQCSKLWHYGMLTFCGDCTCHIKNSLYREIICDTSTLCQCTGLKDKNGKLIWENDIVKINNSKGNVLITFGDFEIICTIPNEKYYKHRLEYDTEYEGVGSVFDNPELLESEG